jgi:hypothetical protein
MVANYYNIRQTDDDNFNPLDRTDELLTEYDESEIIEGDDSLNRLKNVGTAFVQGAAGVPDLALGLTETLYNIPGKFTGAKYTRLPRLVSEEDRAKTLQEGGLAAQAAMLAGGLAGGVGLGQIGAIRNLLYAAPVEAAVANTASKFFTNMKLGQGVLGNAVRASGRVAAYGTGAGVANIVGDTGYNLAESTDDDGNVDLERFGQMEADSALWGAAFGGGLSIADPMVIKDVKGVITNLNKTSNMKAKQAIDVNAKQLEEVNAFEEQRRIQKQLEEENLQAAIEEPKSEIEILDETVDLDDKPLDWADDYKKAKEAYEEDVALAFKEEAPIGLKEKVKTKMSELVEGTGKKVDEAKQVYREIREPIFRELERLSPFGKMVARKENNQLIKTGARGTEARRFGREYTKAFRAQSLGDRIKNLGKKTIGKNTDEEIFKLAVSNQDFDNARAILRAQKNGDDLLKEFDNALKVYSEVGDEAIMMGIIKPENIKENYWARYVKDPDQFQKKIFGKLDDATKSEFAQEQARKMAELDRPLTPRENAQLLESFMRNYNQAIRRSGHTKARKIDKITGEMSKYYVDPVTALDEYIKDMTRNIEEARLLKMKDPMYEPTMRQVKNRVKRLQDEGIEGTPGQLEQEARRSLYKDNMIKDRSKVITDDDIEVEFDKLKKQQLEEGKWAGYEDEQLKEVAGELLKSDQIPNLIEKKVDYLIQSKQLDPANASRYKDLLNSLYVKGRINKPKFMQDLSNWGYSAILGNLNSVMTQIKDIAPTMQRHGVRRAMKTYWDSILSQLSGGKSSGIEYKLNDLGLENNLDEIYGVDPSKKARYIDFVLKPLGWVDKVGAEGLGQASLDKWRKAVKTDKGVNQLVKKYGDVFTKDEMNNLVESLRDGESNFNTKSLTLYEIAEMRPTSLADKPKAYLDNPKARILYDLQNFAVKRQDYIYNELLKDARKGNVEGLLKYLTIAPLISYSVESAKDKIKGREDESVVDKAFLAFMDTIGLNQIGYVASRPTSSSRDMAGAITSSVATLPPLAISAGADIGYDVSNLILGKKGLEDIYSTRYIPFIGPYVKPALRGAYNQGGKSEGGIRGRVMQGSPIRGRALQGRALRGRPIN